MGRVTLLLLFVAACGGTQIPQHNGYKTGDKAKPWKKPKTLKWNDKGEAKAEGTLSYADYRRAIWYAADLPSHGELDLRLEITPGDNVGDDFDLPIEVLDPGNRVIAEDSDAGNLTKQKALLDLDAGKYLIHMYLNGRLDSADYVLKAAFKPTAASQGDSNFPAEVAFLPALPMVPINDDAPKNWKPAQTAVVVHHHGTTPPPPKKEEPAVAAVTARIIGVSVSGGGTTITFAAKNMKSGMNGKVTGQPGITFTVGGCNGNICTATVKATPDQVNRASTVDLTP